ncbi:TetR family transcriptional regulator [Aliidongia dinghuensis]|uniref:TetR family transcriptional regulator n=1 Tax=Aliidongia dinghuensis TaxID=1867774 RepID=A0A8J2YNF6_9PROT|nr:TetR/AcrR family transcriptional regulator [Aliidongia dinghuensis]GGE98790.1 TetR family transcriptional regulator [Aliidongia dinghuensis]
MATSRTSEITSPAAALTEAAPAPQGRPRSRAVDDAILRAAMELFFEHGVQGASIEKIAKRAGVAKTSIYRRWSSREVLLAQAIEVFRSTIGPSVEVMDRTPPDMFLALLIDACGAIARPQVRKLLTRLIGSIADCPSLMAVYRENYLLPRRNAFVRALVRMREAGLVPAASDPELLADMLIGALVQRVVITPSTGDTPEALRGYLIRLLRQAGVELPDKATGA